jgi:KDO2-lipid IV(A) lauroyltransferase
MNALGFYVSVALLWLISLLPFWLLYRVSDAVRVVLFHVVRYRRRVIAQNLRAAFPDRSDAERADIERAFYRHFVDLVLETFKELSASKAAIEARCTTDAASIAMTQGFKQRNQDVIGVMGHCGNWEWAGTAYNTQRMGLRMAVLYSPLTNARFERLIHWMRTRHGLELIPTRSARRAIPAQIGTGTMFTFIADQAAHPAHAYWTTFLHQDTAVFRGAERFACEYDLPVVYISIRKVRRGHYHMSGEVLVEHPRELAPDAVTELFTRRLEQDVMAHPENWLWSHRRWKHPRPGPGRVAQ